MKENTKIILLGIFALGVLFAISFFNPTFSKNEDIKELEYVDNEEVMKDNIYNFIAYYDDYLIPNTSYNLSNMLNENYDFLVNFACSYILHNPEKYNIRTIDNIKYVDINEIYNITSNLFDRNNFYIINDNKMKNNLIELKLVNDRIFDLYLEKITDYNKALDSIFVVAYYNKDTKYKYSFQINDNRLIIQNVEQVVDE